MNGHRASGASAHLYGSLRLGSSAAYAPGADIISIPGVSFQRTLDNRGRFADGLRRCGGSSSGLTGLAAFRSTALKRLWLPKAAGARRSIQADAATVRCGRVPARSRIEPDGG